MSKLFDKLYLNVGAMKAGTTWLFRQLEQHPSIVFSHEKELHYLSYRDGNHDVLNPGYKSNRRDNALSRFTGDHSSPEYAELLQWYDSYTSPEMDDNWYRERFPKQLKPNQYCADFSNLTCLVEPPTLKAILAMANQVKVSYVLRDPFDRMWSHYKFHHQMQQKTIQPETLKGTDFRDFNEATQTMKHSAYSRHIIRMQRFLGKENLKLIAYDDIKNRPSDVLVDIEDFLGIAHHTYLTGKLTRKINTSEEASAPACFYRTFNTAVINEFDALASLGFTIPESWLEKVKS